MKILKEENIEYTNTSDLRSSNDWEEAYEYSDSIDDKMMIISDALNKVGVNDVSFIGNSIPPVVIDNWVKSMKWSEIFKPGNHFIEILKSPSAKFITNGQGIFIKVYNAYVNDSFDNTDFNNVKTGNHIIFNDDLYRQDQNGINYIIKSFDKYSIQTNNFKDQNKLSLFFEFNQGEFKTKLDIIRNAKVKNWQELSFKNKENEEQSPGQKVEKEFSKMKKDSKVNSISKIIKKEIKNGNSSFLDDIVKMVKS